MVQALRRHVDALLEGNEHYAELGCKLATALEMDLSPELVERGQRDWLRPLLRATEQRLSKLRARRRGEQSERLEGRIEKNPELSQHLGNHQELLKVRRRALRQRRRILRQVGDALAWIICGMEPQIIAPYSAPGRRQHIPDGIGGFGPMYIRTQAHETGEYYVVENDLTRCLGVGDLTVVPVDAIGSHRIYPMEVKTHGELEEGTQAEIEAGIPTTEDDEYDREFLEVFSERIGLFDAAEPEGEYRGRERRQMDEIVAQTETLRENLGSITFRIPNPRPIHIDSIKEVIRRAEINGVGWDFPERGLAFAAVRLGEGYDPIESLSRAVESLKRAGLGDDPSAKQFAASSFELHRFDRASAYIRPIALWPLSLRQRTMLLSEQIIFIAWHEAERIEAAFSDRGLDLRWEEGGWVIEKNACEPIVFNRIEVGKAIVSVLFSGASPAELARGIDEAIRPL